jgi:peroxin-3
MEEQERLREMEQEMQEGVFDSMGIVGSLMASVAPSLSSSLGMGFSSIHSEEDEPTRAFDENQFVDEDIERKYLTLSWWLLHIGWRDLASSVRAAVEDVLQGYIHFAEVKYETDPSTRVSLKSRLSMSDLRVLILQMRKQIEFQADGKTRTEYVLPQYH